MADERDDIRARVDIVDLIGREIQLKRVGKTWKGLCPFHPDKNPSFTVSPETGRYKCWSCGEAGDIFTWVMKRQNVEFGEAIQTLAKQAGITLKQRGAGIPPSQRQMHEEAMSAALAFFRDQLKSSPFAQEYCERRDLDAAVLDRWEIGYAPDVGEALATHLKKKGFSLAECKNLFLVDTDASGGFYDKFRGRLMIPIRDEKGALVAFGGRVLGDGSPKYINSSDTPLYRKSRVLYGMSIARDTIAKLRQAVLVEGYLDVIACHRAGVTQAVASLGTSLAEDQAKLLKRWCDEAVILYDGDAAGVKAADRAIDILRAEGLRVRVAAVDAGEDPDTILKQSGPAAVRDAATAALEPIEYKLRALAKVRAYTDDAFWEEAAEILCQAEGQAELDRHIAEIAPHYPWQRNPTKAASQLRSTVLAKRRRSAKKAAVGPSAQPEHYSLRSSLSSPEIVLLRAVVREDLRGDAWRFATAPDLFETSVGEGVANALAVAFPGGMPQGPSSEWLHQVEPDDVRQVLSDIALDFRSENLSSERVADCVEKLQETREKRTLEAMRRAGANTEDRFRLLKAMKPDSRPDKEGKQTLF